jgi:hypothetical protein
MLPQPPPVFIAMVLLALLSLSNLVPAEQVILEGKPTAAVFLPLVVGVGGLLALGGCGGSSAGRCGWSSSSACSTSS